MIEVTIPGHAPSTPNQRLHWAAKAKQTEGQRARVRRRLPDRDVLPALLSVRITRVAPRRLDDDNLRGAMKAHRDAVASWLRVDDASPLVRWEYAQERGEVAVRIQVEVLGEQVSLSEPSQPAVTARAPRALQPTPNVVRGGR